MPAKCVAWCLLCLAFVLRPILPAYASSLRISPASAERSSGEIEADYGMSHLFIDEVAHDSVPITIFFDPQAPDVVEADVFTNLDRRDLATVMVGSESVEEGISPPLGNTIDVGDERHYYHAVRMQPVPGGYQVTLAASKTGAYRVTARYRVASDPAGTWHWYDNEASAPGVFKRDFAIVVSPAKARDVQLYEANPLSTAASGTSPAQRGTFAAMSAPASGTGAHFSLEYLQQLGVNTLWLQPIHPRGIAGRLTDPTTGQAFALGSPYAVKNYFAVMPLMASGLLPGASMAENDNAAGRALAMTEFQTFARKAATKGIGLFLDVPFNHAAHDLEMAPAGVRYWADKAIPDTTPVSAVEARVFSRAGEYDMRASGADDVADAPDRFDFGKWTDVADFFFGRYAALVANQSDAGAYQNEADWFDYSVGSETASGDASGHFDHVTQGLWRYFGDYLQFWLGQTGYPGNSRHAALNVAGGISGLRADFAQGLPPQAWEYIVNRTRARRWDFVFMAESLDGGHVGYRSARHFDIINDSLVSDLHGATTATDLQHMFAARSFYGDALILLNTTSQDEDSYRDPYQGALRFAVNSAMYGATLIFPGQELGLAGTIVPPSGASDPSAGAPFGYERYETDTNFHKPIPQFLTYNSMMPLWRQLDRSGGDAHHLLSFYTAVSHARMQSAALRSKWSSPLSLQGGGAADNIFAVGKTAQPGGDPAKTDVVFAFVNLDLRSASTTPPGRSFDVDVPFGGANIFGIRRDHRYQVRNIAATAVNERKTCLWPDSVTGANLLANGIYVSLNRLPDNDAGWSTSPYEAQYLKLIDLTASPKACSATAPDAAGNTSPDAAGNTSPGAAGNTSPGAAGNTSPGAAGDASHGASNDGAVTQPGSRQAVLTRSYDNGRTGANTAERVLTPDAIRARGLTRAFSLVLAGDDPRIEAQPLYVPGVSMPDGKVHDVVYAFSMSNHVWAFDADSGAALWPHPVSLGAPFLPASGDAVDVYGINRSFGILSTPVIDRGAGLIYAVAWIVDGHGDRQLHLNALRLSDGAAPPGKTQPLPVQATAVNAAGQTVSLSQVQKQRAALLLVPLSDAPDPHHHKMLYVATTGDDEPPSQPDATLGHHGWVVAFDVDDWHQAGAWTSTPSSFGGGIWQGAQGLSADDSGNVYALTSNGGYLVGANGSITDFNGRSDHAESFVRLTLHNNAHGTSLDLADWFTPFRDADRRDWTIPDVMPFRRGYDYADQDLGSSGPVLPPGTDLVLGAGKDGVLYAVDRNDMGRTVGDLSKLATPPVFLTYDPDTANPAYAGATPSGNLDFKPQPGFKTHHLHGSPVYWQSASHGGMLFAWGENAQLRAFSMTQGGRTKLLAHSTAVASAALAQDAGSIGGMPGGMLTLSANGKDAGVVWGTAPLNGDANTDPVAGVIRAYDATNFASASGSRPATLRLLWEQAGFSYSKFCPPVVADGRLLVPTYDGRIDVYRLSAAQK